VVILLGLLDKLRSGREEREAARVLAEQQTRVAVAAQQARDAHEAYTRSMLNDWTTSISGVVLKPGEVAYALAEDARFVEPRREPGKWVGASHGVSFRVAKGVRYRVGASKGTYQQGEERPAVTDVGTFVVTSQRCVFIGTKRTTEWAYSKLLGFSLEGEGVALFNVSNRQKTTGVFYGADKEAALDAVIAAAIAQYQSPDDHAALVDELQREYVHSHAVWEALNRGEEPPTAPLPPPSLAPSRELDRPDTATGVTLPSRESIAEVLGGAGFAAADNSEGFGVRHEGDRLKVFWVRSDQSGREANVPAMAKALRDFGMKARVAREDNYPYVSVTG
jgi:hypothetical protein